MNSVSIFFSHRARTYENAIRQDRQDFKDLKSSKSRGLERLRLTGVRFLLKYLSEMDSDPQITLITLMFKKLAWLDRLKKWEPMGHKNERAHFCASRIPIIPKAQPWDPRVAEFPAVLASNHGHPVNPV